MDVTDDLGSSPLHYAVNYGYDEITKLLIEAGCNVNYIFKPGDSSALHYAVQRGRTHIVTLLLEKGADPNLQNSKDRTPLLESC